MPKLPNFKQAGFVLLYAVLVSSIVLSVGLSLINLVTKQIILSSIGRNSQFAYYAADAGKQCAYFWYASLYPVFGIPNGSTIDPPVAGDLPGELLTNNQVTIYCQGGPILVDQTPLPSGTGLVSTFRFSLSNSPGESSCSDVRVTRNVTSSNDPDNPKVETEIRSSGYNASCNDLASGVQNPRRIERVVYRVDR